MPGITAIRGFKDILPDEAHIWRLIEHKAAQVAARFDYQELRPPIVERTGLFARGIGEATDIVEKEMYTMEDRNGDKITLRPEATAGMVRAVLEHNLAGLGRATKLYCLGPMFRYERPQKGRQRQFHQLDVEVFGDASPYIDAEVIHWLFIFLSELGLEKPTITLNSLGCPNCRPSFRQTLVPFLSDKKDSLCPDCQRRLDLNPLRVLDCKNESCQATVREAPTILSALCPECRSHFDQVTKALSELALDYNINPLLVRGLDYYSRTAFEVHSESLGSQNAVAGGGRYDGLCRLLGGPDLPGIGFAVGLERLVMLLSGAKLPPGPDYYVASLCPEALEPAFLLVQKLRGLGQRISCDWESGSLKSRLKRADKSGANRVIMIGSDELAKGQVTIRDLNTKEQWSLALSDLGSF